MQTRIKHEKGVILRSLNCDEERKENDIKEVDSVQSSNQSYTSTNTNSNQSNKSTINTNSTDFEALVNSSQDQKDSEKGSEKSVTFKIEEESETEMNRDCEITVNRERKSYCASKRQTSCKNQQVRTKSDCICTCKRSGNSSNKQKSNDSQRSSSSQRTCTCRRHHCCRNQHNSKRCGSLKSQRNVQYVYGMQWETSKNPKEFTMKNYDNISEENLDTKSIAKTSEFGNIRPLNSEDILTRYHYENLELEIAKENQQNEKLDEFREKTKSDDQNSTIFEVFEFIANDRIPNISEIPKLVNDIMSKIEKEKSNELRRGEIKNLVNMEDTFNITEIGNAKLNKSKVEAENTLSTVERNENCRPCPSNTPNATPESTTTIRAHTLSNANISAVKRVASTIKGKKQNLPKGKKQNQSKLKKAKCIKIPKGIKKKPVAHKTGIKKKPTNTVNNKTSKIIFDKKFFELSDTDSALTNQTKILKSKQIRGDLRKTKSDNVGNIRNDILKAKLSKKALINKVPTKSSTSLGKQNTLNSNKKQNQTLQKCPKSYNIRSRDNLDGTGTTSQCPKSYTNISRDFLDRTGSSQVKIKAELIHEMNKKKRQTLELIGKTIDNVFAMMSEIRVSPEHSKIKMKREESRDIITDDVDDTREEQNLDIISNEENTREKWDKMMGELETSKHILDMMDRKTAEINTKREQNPSERTNGTNKDEHLDKITNKDIRKNLEEVNHDAETKSKHILDELDRTTSEVDRRKERTLKSIKRKRDTKIPVKVAEKTLTTISEQKLDRITNPVDTRRTRIKSVGDFRKKDQELNQIKELDMKELSNQGNKDDGDQFDLIIILDNEPFTNKDNLKDGLKGQKEEVVHSKTSKDAFTQSTSIENHIEDNFNIQNVEKVNRSESKFNNKTKVKQSNSTILKEERKKSVRKEQIIPKGKEEIFQTRKDGNIDSMKRPTSHNRKERISPTRRDSIESIQDEISPLDQEKERSTSRQKTNTSHTSIENIKEFDRTKFGLRQSNIQNLLTKFNVNKVPLNGRMSQFNDNLQSKNVHKEVETLKSKEIVKNMKEKYEISGDMVRIMRERFETKNPI
ncbi:hypothetical protein WDU94_006357 [Cyamophila willieti]